MQNQVVKQPDLSELLKPYENRWVAISDDGKRVLAEGKTLEEAISKLDKNQKDKASFMKVLPFDAGYVPTTS